MPRSNGKLRSVVLTKNVIDDFRPDFRVRYSLANLIRSEVNMLEDLVYSYQTLQEHGIGPKKIMKMISGSEKTYVSLNFEILKAFLTEEMCL